LNGFVAVIGMDSLPNNPAPELRNETIRFESAAAHNPDGAATFKS
jgi:hypothetical protein